MERVALLYRATFIIRRVSRMETTVGNRIKSVRNIIKLSQENFAKSLSITRNMVAKYENDLVDPPEILIDFL